ncbi:MAG: GAF domain-containing protein, partial [Bradyrhizobium sp.]|nr:GAF domain-containing protein [Bradyrhizobium sp.]
MTVVSEDATADLNRRIAELEERLAAALAERDAAIERQTAGALVGFRLQSELRAAGDRQTATSEILASISGSIADPTPVFEAVLDNLLRLFGTRFAAVFLLRDGMLHVAGLKGDPGFEELASYYPLPADDRVLPGRAVITRRALQIAPIAGNPDAPAATQNLAQKFGYNALMSVPMIRQGNVIGVLSTAHRDPIAFTERQIQLATSFADQAVIAIENTRLFNETREALERQTATADILKVIAGSPSDVQPVFEAIVGSAARLFAPTTATITTLKDGKLHWGALATRSDFDFSGASKVYPLPFDPDRSPSARAILERRIIEIADTMAPDTPELTRNASAAGGFRSAIFVPLLRGEQGIGSIILAHPQVGFKFSEKQLALVQTFADQAVIAIENTRLFNETKEALERQTATADILKVIASSPADVQPVFEAIATRAKTLLNGFSSTVYRFIDGQAYLEAFTPTTAEADEILKSTFPMPVSRFAPFEIAQAGEVTQVPDTETLTGEVLDIARARGFRSMLCTPLMNKGTAIGFIVVTRASTGTFADHHMQLLKTFADQAVIAIENTRLFNEVQARTRDLEESLQQQTATADVLKVISRSTFDLQTVLETLIKSAVELSGANRGSIFLREGEVFPLKAASSTTPEFLQYWAQNPPKAGRGSATSRVIASGKVEIIPDVLQDPEMQMSAGALVSIRAALGVPMLRDNRVEGVLVLTRPEPGAFTKSQIDLVQTFADQAVIAVENVRLFDETEARTRELAKSLEDLRTAQDRLIQTEKLASLGQLTAGIAHEIKNPLNFVNNFAALSAELTDELKDALKPAVLDQSIRAEVDELTSLVKDNLAKVVQHGRRADSIVKNMLLHSREGSGDHRPADINALVEESLNLAYHGARAEKPQFNVTLQRNLDPEAGMIEVFPQEITRVFLNLIANG